MENSRFTVCWSVAATAGLAATMQFPQEGKSLLTAVQTQASDDPQA